MRDLSLHILDIAQNSLRADASFLILRVEELPTQNKLCVMIKDNGKGMPKEMLKTLTDPFTTTRTLRKVGLGIPLLAQLCHECEGGLKIDSELGKGTTLWAELRYDHIDRLPLGNIAETFTTLIMGKPCIRYRYEHLYEDRFFEVDTFEVKQLLEGVPIENLEVLAWLKNYIDNNIAVLKEKN